MIGRFLVFLGGLFVVVLFVALLAPLFIDWTDFRRNFEDQASRIIGKKVTVHGSVDARLLPFPSVTLHDVRVGQEPDGAPTVQVEQFSMDAELAPFLSGEVLIFDMRIVNPKARLRLLKDGTLDWTRGSHPEIPARNVVLENVHLQGANVEFIDEQSGRTRKLSDVNAEMSAKSLAGPWRIEGDGSVDGGHGTFLFSSSQIGDDGILRLRSRLQPDDRPLTVDLDGELKLIDSKPQYQGQISAVVDARDGKASAERKEAMPRLKGKFELTNESIRLPEYRLEVGGADDPYVVTGEATLDTGPNPQFLLTADGQQIDVNRIGNHGASGKTSRDPALSAKQRLNTLIQIVSQIPVPQVPGKASLRLPAIVAGDTTIRDVQLDLEPAGSGWKIDRSVGILPGRTKVEATGLLSLRNEPSFNGSVIVASNQPSALATWLSGAVDPAIRRLQQAGFSADVSLTHQRQRFEKLEIALGEASLSGRLERNSTANQTPTLDVALEGDALDLDALQALTGLFTGEQAGENVLDHRVSARLKAEKFTAFGVEAQDVETSFVLSDGALALDKLAIKSLAGAEVTATGRAEGSLLDYKGSGEITFKAADPGTFLAMLKDHLPAHPAMDRLVRNAAWYSNTALRGVVTLGGEKSGLAVTLAGVANGSRINLDYRMSDLLALTGTGTTSLEATLENNVTSILFGQAGLDPLPVEADANGRLTLKVKAEGSEPAQANFSYATDRTSFVADGKIDIRPQSFMNGQMNLSLESADLDPYLVMNGIGVPQSGTGLPFKMQAVAEIDNDRIALSKIEGHGADNSFSGSIALDRKAPRPTGQGDLALSSIDADWLGEAVYGPVFDPSSGKLASNAFGIPAFKDVDFKLKLTARAFQPGWGGPVEDFFTDVTYRGEELRLDNLSGKWDGGQLGGSLMLSNSGGTGFLQSRVTIRDAGLGSLFWPREGTTLADGKFNLQLSAEASGKTAADLVAALNGSGEIALGETSIRGLNLSMFPALLAATDSMQDQITAGKIHPIAETLLNNGEARLPPTHVPFNITEGMLRLQNVVTGNDVAKLSGDAQIDLLRQRINAVLAIGFNPGTELLAGAEPVLKLNFGGLLSSPGRTMDVTDLTGYLSLRAFERERRRVERLQANVLEKQRLRREVSLYKFAAAERERAAAEEAARRAEEERLRGLAEEAARQRELARQKAEAQAKAAAEAKARAADPAQGATTQTAPSQPAAPLNFDTLPGNRPPPL